MRTVKTFGSKIVQRASICALAFFVTLATQHAQATTPNAQQLVAYEAASEVERVKLLIFLAKNGEVENVRMLLSQYPLQGPHATNRMLFIDGLLLKSEGRLTQAAEKFRGALAADPSLTLVRAELAETLVTLQEDDSAKHHLKLLAAEAPSEAAASGIRSFIDKVDSRTPFKFSGYVSFAPSTNLNNGSKNDTVYSPVLNANLVIDDANKAKSGLGVAGGLNAAYTKRLGNDFMFVTAGNANARLYDNSDFNSYGLSETAELRFLVKHGHFGFGGVSSQSLDTTDYAPSYISFGPRFSASLQVTAKDHITGGVVHEWRETLDVANSQSTALMFDAAWTHAWNSSFTTTLFSGLDVINTNSDQTSYRSLSGGLSIYKELPRGITANVTGIYTQSDFEGYNGILALTRADQRLTGSIELTKRDFNIFGFAPSVSYSYTDNLSNADNYDYDNHAVDMRLTKDF